MYLKLEKLSEEEKTDLIDNIKNVISCTKTAAQAAILLNLDYKKFKRLCEKLNIEFIKNQSKKGIIDENGLIDILNNIKPCRSDYLKRLLFKTKMLEERCNICGIVDWNGMNIIFHLDHIDGDHFNNNIENLRILCPNCHSQTETYCRKKKRLITEVEFIEAVNKSENINNVCNILKLNNGKSYEMIRKRMKELNIKFKQKNTEESNKGSNYCSCGKKINNRAKQCNVCYKFSQRKVVRPEYEKLKQEIMDNGYSWVGRKYGVSDNAIRKWVKEYEKNEIIKI